MKYVNIIILALCLLQAGCTVVYFENPQPFGYDALNSFPDEYHGTYLQDNDTLYIVSEGVKGYDNESKNIPLSSLDTLKNIWLDAGKVFDKNYSDVIGLPYVIRNDTLIYEYRTLETMNISDSLILKQFKKYLVLNMKEGSDWMVFLLKKSKNDLILYDVNKVNEDSTRIESIIDEKNLKRVKIETSMKLNIEDSYLINPTVKEFNTLIKKGFFKESEEIYKKIE